VRPEQEITAKQAGRMSPTRSFAAALAASLCLALLAATPSVAEFGLAEVEVGFGDEAGAPAMEAGSHPFAMSTTTVFNTVNLPSGGELPEQLVKDVQVELPTGLIGNPRATPRCPQPNFIEISDITLLPNCSDDSVVGIIGLKGRIDQPLPGEGQPETSFLPVYNLAPGPGEVAKLGFAFAKVPVTIDIEVEGHSPQKGLPVQIVATFRNISQVLQIYSAELIVWGDPSSPAHDSLRGSCLDQEVPGVPTSKGNCPFEGGEHAPFLTMPRSCAGPLETEFALDSWVAPGVFVRTTAVTDDGSIPPEGVTGCSELDFDPEVSLRPTSAQADSPSGAAFDLEIDDPGLVSGDPGALAQSDIKKAVVTFPPGITVNPALAGGLEACTSAQIAAETAGSAFGSGCPGGSKIGSVEVETPLLDEELTGSVFVAKQQDNPFGSLLAIYIVIKNPALGVSVSLAGRVDPDSRTGRLVTTFDDLPQIPFSHFELDLRDGPRAPLITPSACGNYAVTTELTPWANPGETMAATTPFELTSGAGGGGCPSGNPFAPSLSAGTANPLAGAFSPFALRLTRNDGTDRISGLDLTLPEGLTGKLAGIPYCGEAALAAAAAQSRPGQGAAQIAAPSCPAASQVGTVTVGAGAGSSPVYVSTGRAYLAGPYKGAPLSMAIVTPAVTGPFDLGNVVVRAALQVDPATAQIRVVSDPLPTILHGIPLDLRDIQVSVDRPGFTLNPTSCDQSQFSGAATSERGASAPLSDRFQVGSCTALPFKPKLSLRLSGQTKRDGHPGLSAVLTQKPGQANIDQLAVTLPPTELIDNAHLGSPCTRPQFAEGKCPPKSLLGRARAFTPLLDEPLEGSVYFRANGGEYPLPDIVMDLNGQVRLIVVGHVDSVRKKGSGTSRLRTTFNVVPDAPVSKVALRLFGGKRGLLVNSRNLCAAPRRAKVVMDGQNGKPNDFLTPIGIDCGRSRKKKK
jgi:hypothetical protein